MSPRTCAGDLGQVAGLTEQRPACSGSLPSSLLTTSSTLASTRRPVRHLGDARLEGAEQGLDLGLAGAEAIADGRYELAATSLGRSTVTTPRPTVM